MISGLPPSISLSSLTIIFGAPSLSIILNIALVFAAATFWRFETTTLKDSLLSSLSSSIIAKDWVTERLPAGIDSVFDTAE